MSKILEYAFLNAILATYHITVIPDVYFNLIDTYINSSPISLQIHLDL